MKQFFLLALVALLWVGCKENAALNAEAERFSANTKSALAVLPKDADIITKVDVANLRSDAPSLFGNFSMGAAPTELEDLIAATGFDPKKDVKAMYMAIQKKTEDDVKMNAVVFADFDKDKLTQYIQSQVGSKFTSSTYRNNAVYCSTDGDSAQKPCFSIGQNQMLHLANNEANLKAMVDLTFGEGNSISTDTEMMTLLNLTSTDDEGWVLIRDAQKMVNAANLAPQGGTPQEQGGMMAMNQIAAALKSVVIRTDVTEANTRSLVWMLPKDGVTQNDLKSMFDAGLSAARYMIQQQKPEGADAAQLEAFTGILENTKVSLSGKGVMLDTSVPNHMLKK